MRYDNCLITQRQSSHNLPPPFKALPPPTYPVLFSSSKKESVQKKTQFKKKKTIISKIQKTTTNSTKTFTTPFKSRHWSRRRCDNTAIGRQSIHPGEYARTGEPGCGPGGRERALQRLCHTIQVKKYQKRSERG